MAQLPPPVHGSAIINKNTYESEKIRDHFELTWLNISLGHSIESIGKLEFNKLWNYLKLHFKLFYTLMTKRFDAAYMTLAPVGKPFLKDSLLIIWLRLFGTKRIFHLHEKGISKKVKKGSFLNRYYNFILKNSTIIHLSKLLTHDLKNIHTIRGIHLIPNGIEELPFNDDTVIRNEILYISNFLETKGAGVLLEAAKILVDRKLDFKLTMAGGWVDNNFRAALEDYYNSNEWEGKVILRGPAYGQEKKELFARSGILVYPTMLDCFPLVILEAMSNGSAVIASREGAISEIIENGSNGIVVEPGNAQILADRIEELLKNDQMWRDMRHKARRDFQELYSLNIFEKKFIEVMSEILAEKF